MYPQITRKDKENVSKWTIKGRMLDNQKTARGQVMEPEEFIRLTNLSEKQVAKICARSYDHVRKWFVNGPSRRTPQPTDLRVLELYYRCLILQEENKRLKAYVGQYQHSRR